MRSHMVGQGSRGREGREDFKRSYSILIMPNTYIHTYIKYILYATYFSKHITCINIFNIYDNLGSRWFYPPLREWGNWGTERRDKGDKTIMWQSQVSLTAERTVHHDWTAGQIRIWRRRSGGCEVLLGLPPTGCSIWMWQSSCLTCLRQKKWIQTLRGLSVTHKVQDINLYCRKHLMIFPKWFYLVSGSWWRRRHSCRERG